jgi:hypothetical protein
MGAILRAHGPAYRQRFGTRMAADQLRALRDLAACHTPVLGGVCWHCPQCRERVFAYRSCGNRHCPACGQAEARAWLHRQQGLLLPGVTYHLVTFTVPEVLRRSIRSHPREALPILFDAARSALLDLCRDPRFLGGRPGLTAILHTWTRQLLYHPHLHFLATGGGLRPDGAWREAHPRFLVPVRALSVLFRSRVRDAWRKRLPALFATLPPAIWRQPWVVHSKPVGSGEHALAYLARYLHRVALADSAILRQTSSEVVFRYRDSATGRPRTARLAPGEFLRRFLQHVLPSGFRKVRHFGLHHPSQRKALRLLQAQLAFVRRLPLPVADPPVPAAPPRLCPTCHIPLCAQGPLPRASRAAAAPSPDANARGPPCA